MNESVLKTTQMQLSKTVLESLAFSVCLGNGFLPFMLSVKYNDKESLFRVCLVSNSFLFHINIEVERMQ